MTFVTGIHQADAGWSNCNTSLTFAGMRPRLFWWMIFIYILLTSFPKDSSVKSSLSFCGGTTASWTDMHLKKPLHILTGRSFINDRLLDVQFINTSCILWTGWGGGSSEFAWKYTLSKQGHGKSISVLKWSRCPGQWVTDRLIKYWNADQTFGSQRTIIKFNIHGHPLNNNFVHSLRLRFWFALLIVFWGNIWFLPVWEISIYVDLGMLKMLKNRTIY